jgi:hypothetical protein
MDWTNAVSSMLRYAVAMFGRVAGAVALRIAVQAGKDGAANPKEIEMWKRVATDCGRIAALLTFDEQQALETVSTQRRT